MVILDNRKKSHLKDGNIILTKEDENLNKYTFSNAMAQSVKLGIWEASLDRYIDSIEFVTEDLKVGKKIRMTQPEVLRKQGELFALRHQINLTSDLLDTPDFYWERDDLESLYQRICGYFNIAKRTKVSIHFCLCMRHYFFCTIYIFYTGNEREIKSLFGTSEHFIVAFKRSSSRSFGVDDHRTYYGRGRF